MKPLTTEKNRKAYKESVLIEDMTEENPTIETPNDVKPLGEEIAEPEPSANSMINDAKQAAERLEAANKKQEELLTRTEELYAKQLLGGRSVAGQTQVEEKLTDTQYAEALQRGEVNPMREDGFK